MEGWRVQRVVCSSMESLLRKAEDRIVTDDGKGDVEDSKDAVDTSGYGVDILDA